MRVVVIWVSKGALVAVGNRTIHSQQVDVENTMGEQVKLFTREELKGRNKREDAVLIIHNGVYDVTKFLEEVSLFYYIYLSRQMICKINSQ